jgi:hypothetical protein
LGDGFATTILEPGMPGAGPFKFRSWAAQWAHQYIKREMFADAEFGPIPDDQTKTVEQQELSL